MTRKQYDTISQLLRKHGLVANESSGMGGWIVQDHSLGCIRTISMPMTPKELLAWLYGYAACADYEETFQ